MAFPATYNISYYKGDTLEFTIYPKDASGAVFDLEEYASDISPAFTISTARGLAGAENQISCYAEISETNDYILCVIRPEDSLDLEAGVTYVYDVEITKNDDYAEYDIVHTLLTGTVTVTDQVTGAAEENS